MDNENMYILGGGQRSQLILRATEDGRGVLRAIEDGRAGEDKRPGSRAGCLFSVEKFLELTRIRM